MDYLYFLKTRTKFIRQYYADAASPFDERRRKIAQGEEPFNPDASGIEDGEPPFLEEWLEAGEALDVLGQQCVSLLASSLHLFMQEWISELISCAGTEQLTDLGIGVPTDSQYRTAFKKGWINGYSIYCAKIGIEWTKGPADLALLEQIVLARNTAQHSSDITSMRAAQPISDLRKHPQAFFADEAELALINPSHVGRYSFPVPLNVTEDKLLKAVDQVEQFCSWLDELHPMRR